MSDEDSIAEVQQCVICQQESDEAIILCPSFHSYCSDCLNNSIQTDLMDNKVVKGECLVCRDKFYEEKYESMLWEETRRLLIKRNLFSCFNLPENLYLLNCPTCEKNKEAAILIDKDDYVQYYNCDLCKKNSCLYCRKEIKSKNHDKCRKYLNICKDLEKVIEYGVSHNCSKCKPRIISDYTIPNLKAGCSHITCHRCNMESCYICGGHVEDIDKSSTSGGISGHNTDWKTNPKRCPMYINYFKDVVKDFPQTEIDATVLFRSYKIKAFTKKVIDKHGKTNVKEAFEVFKDTRLANLKDENYIDCDYQPYEFIDQKIFSIFNI
jgi:hypothetical protein